MTQLRDIENNHHEKVTELAITLLERHTKNQLEEDLHDDLRVVSSIMVYSSPPLLLAPLIITISFLQTKTRW